MVERALAERRAKLGEEHTFTIATANGLALMYKAQRRYAEAEALYLHSLAICQRTLGDKALPDHRHSQRPGLAL